MRRGVAKALIAAGLLLCGLGWLALEVANGLACALAGSRAMCRAD
ncbi:MAG: hypothetical protein Q4G22_04085 [Paracoccus sp. (in: a-proteobacteria)]|nr:hypothetical protein [Paracoccus sp. (in: a-proteobacteria)]MDO5630997.1 hypothetical protein [Paracoccus sp. (in: a-proteobacteria)]